MKKTHRAKAVLSDSFWSILGLVLMNAAAQLAVYPFWSRLFGEETYGNVLYLLSYINIPAVSCGSALNYARMVASHGGKTENGDYNVLLLGFCALGLPYVLAVRALTGADFFLFWLLLCLTVWRFYADVEFRLSLNYKGYFCYYLLIGGGYLLGVPLCRATGCWELALLPGELLGLVYVFLRGTSVRQRFLKTSAALRGCVASTGILLTTQLIQNLIFNADRLLLKNLLDGTAVTTYYLASLIGKTMSLITTPLNSVIIGYLARYRGKATRRMYLSLLGILLLLLVMGTAACVAATHLFIRLIYPDSYAAVRPLIFIASISQVLYFVTNVLTVVLLRFAAQRYQLWINLVFAAAFLALAIPLTGSYGITGFANAFFGANLARLAAAGLLGMHSLTKR